jgi:deazaflavin-dependent oxidoreductase (nitroreductase family)
MFKSPSSPAWWQRLVQRFAATNLGSFLFAKTAHPVDRLTLRLSGGTYTFSSLISGLPVVWLTTIGAKSGTQRSVPLVGIMDGERVVLIASNFGQAHHPSWYFNLRANPQATLAWNGVSAPYTAREASEDERQRYWAQALRLYPGYNAYRRRASNRTIPVMVLSPVEKL